jgi:ubiquitin-conjugating enzyme E2 Z
MLALMSEPLEGILVQPDDTNVCRFHALVTGPDGTPYEGGFFYFLIQCPPEYPAEPPKVRLMTTGGGVVRFNPNLYANGKVCLSLLGTWHGPGWTAAQSLSSILLSIQSMVLVDAPYLNEPGVQASSTAVLQDYNDMVTHETLRVAVVENVARQDSMPPGLRSAMLESFSALSEVYAERCELLAARLDGRQFADPYGANRGTFAFAKLRERILALAAQIEAGALT